MWLATDKIIHLESKKDAAIAVKSLIQGYYSTRTLLESKVVRAELSES